MKRFNQFYTSFQALYRAKIFRKKTLLIITWCVTDQSNASKPCYEFPSRSEKELTADEVIGVIDQLGKAEVKRVILTGGDPMFRFDFGSIIDQLHEKGISIFVETHGFFVERKIEILKLVDKVILPLDGPQEIQDDLRYQDSYQEVLRAARLLKDNKIPFIFQCTLTLKNIDYISVPLEISSHFNTSVYFQPVPTIMPGTKTAHPLIFSGDRMRQAMIKLTRLKKTQYPNIINSEETLNHLYHYPDSSLVHCESGKFCAHIDLNGDLLHCNYARPEYVRNVVKQDLRELFDKLPPVSCSDCWQAYRHDLHKLSSFSLRNIFAFFD